MTYFQPLKVVDFFRPLFEKMKIDYVVMRKIVEVKLLMDGRRVPTVFSSSTKQKGNQFMKSLLIYMLYSLILLFFVFGDQYMFQMSLVFGISMFLLMTSMIADFSSVLLDVRDKTILHTKPVHLRTINAAKMVHVIIYMTLLTGAFTVIPALVMLFSQGLFFFLLFLLTIILFVSFIIALTSLIYMFVLRFFSGEQLKDLINYIQIILSAGVIIGYQIVIRAFEYAGFTFEFTFSWWNVFIPPMWFAAPFELLIARNFSSGIIVLTVLAVIIPIISIPLYYALMPSFERNLQKLMEESGTARRKRWQFSTLWEKIICFHKEERMFFRFANQMMGAEREFKLKVYPSLGIALVFPFIFIFNDLSYLSLEEIREGNSFLQIYFVNIIVGIVVHMLSFSGKYKGAWIFKAAGVEHPNEMNGATIKAFLVKLYVPIFFIVGTIYCFIFSPRIIVHLFIVFLAAILLAILSYFLTSKGEFPFSKPFESIQQGGGSTVTVILIMIFTALLAGLHYVMILIPYGMYVYLIVLIVTIFILWRNLFSKKSME